MAVTSLITIVSPVFGSNEPIFAFGGGMGCLAETGSSSEFAKVRHKSGARAESRHDRRVKTITPRTPQRPPPVTLCGIFARLRQIKAAGQALLRRNMRPPAKNRWPAGVPCLSRMMAAEAGRKQEAAACARSQKGPFPDATGFSEAVIEPVGNSCNPKG